MAATIDTSPTASDDPYFHSNPSPPFLTNHISSASHFISHHTSTSHDQRLVLVTSGGTTVPLETNMVRFVDNFSAGTRGATSAEWFLRQGYAVIFLHREFSLLPFARHYSHSSGSCFLDFLDPVGSLGTSSADDDAPHDVRVRREYATRMAGLLEEYNTARQRNMLLLLPFTTVNDYLWSLRSLAQLMRPLGGRALFYLAAAVSDFFIPRRKMVEHKIQSSEEFQSHSRPHNGSFHPDQHGKSTNNSTEGSHSSEANGHGSGSTSRGSHSNGPADDNEQAATIEDGKLIVHLDPVPKFLKTLVETWSPEGMIVSFKLETDPNILTLKARYALEKYGHHLVVGNLLSTRKWEVVFVSRTGGKIEEEWIRVPLQSRTKSFSGVMGRPAAEALKEADEQHQQQQNGQTQMEVSKEPKIEIESLMVPRIEKLHAVHVRRIEDGS